MLRSWFNRFAGALACAVAVFVVPTASAQRGDVTASAISTETLERYLNRYVHPAPELQTRIEEAHDRYLDSFRALRDGELDAFSRERPPFMTGGDMEPWLRKNAQLRNKVISLDHGFLDQLRSILPEDQRQSVERIRCMREVEVLRSGFSREMSFGGQGPGQVDMTEIIFSNELSPADLAKADEGLRDLEPRLLTLVRKNTEETEKAFLDLTTKMKKEGMWGKALEDMQQDPEKAKEMMKRMSGYLRDTVAAVRAAQVPVAEANRKAFRSIREQLSEEGKERLQSTWTERAYPGLGDNWVRSVASHRKRIARSQQLTAEQRDAVLHIIDDAAARHRSMLDAAEPDAQHLAEAEFAQFFSAYDEGSAAAAKDELAQVKDIVQKHKDDREKLVTTTMEAVTAAIPPDVAKKLGPDPDAPAIDTDIAFGGAAGQVKLQADAAEQDPDVASEQQAISEAMYGTGQSSSPMSPADIARLATALEIPDSQRATLEALHSDYASQWNDRVAPLNVQLQEARTSMWKPTGDGGMVKADAAKSNEAASIQREIDSVCRQMDDSFFDTIGASVVPKEKADLFAFERLSRTSSLLAHRRTQNMGFMQHTEIPVDVTAVVMKAEISDTDRVQARKEVAAHAAELVQALRAAADATAESDAAMMKLQAELFGGDMSPEDRMTAGQQYMKGIQKIRQQLKGPEEARAAAQQRAFNDACKGMSEGSQSAMRKAWNAAAYPEVFHDPRALFKTIGKLEKLGDLNDAQKTQLSAVKSEYRQAYDLAGDAILAAAMEEVPAPDTMDSSYYMAIQNRERAIERMKFERQETTARAAAKIRRILTPEQLKQFPILAETGVKGSDNGGQW